MAHSHQENLHVGKFQLSNGLRTLFLALMALGLVTVAYGYLTHQMERIWTSYLVTYFYFICLSLGGLFWVSLNNLTKSGWSVSIRRLAEATTAFLPFLIIGGIILLAGLKVLYPWARPEVLEAEPVIAAKVAYLNWKFFALRILVFGIGVLIFRHIIVGNSIKQDTSGDQSLTDSNVGWSIGFIPFFAIFFSLFSVDLLMSLMPTWYSTIYGIYAFSGMFQSFLAFFAIVIVIFKKSSFIKGYITEEHQHDVVKYLKGFTVFWAYIAFSQFMLIWYANIPEETEFFLMRSQGGWTGVSMSLLFLRFIVPFIVLLPRWVKRTDTAVIAVSILVLIMQYVDIFWLVYPNFFEGNLVFGIPELGMMIGFTGLFLWTFTHFLSKNSIVAVKDPRMHEAVAHHVMY